MAAEDEDEPGAEATYELEVGATSRPKLAVDDTDLQARDTDLTDEPWQQRQAVHAVDVLVELAKLDAERKRHTTTTKTQPKCPVVKGRGKVAFTLPENVEEILVPTTPSRRPSPCPSPPPSPKGVAAVAV